MYAIKYLTQLAGVDLVNRFSPYATFKIYPYNCLAHPATRPSTRRSATWRSAASVSAR